MAAKKCDASPSKEGMYSNETEKELRVRESQRFIQQVADTAPYLLYIYDLDQNRPVYMNRQTMKFVGCTTEQVQSLGAAFFQKVVHPDDLDVLAGRVQQLTGLGVDDVIEIEFRMQSAQGNWRWFRSREAVFLTKADGTPKQVIGTAIDITDRKAAEEQIRERESQLAEAQQLAHLGSWDWDIRANRISWSEELYRIYSLTPADFTGTYEGFLEWVHPDDRNLVRKAVERAYDRHVPFSCEHRIVRPDGAVRILQTRGKVVTDEAGQPIRIIGTGQDITERKQAEEQIRTLNAELEQRVTKRTAELKAINRELEEEIAERRRIEEELQKSNTILQAIIEGTSDGIFVKDIKGHYVMINSAGARNMGKRIGDVIGKHDAMLLPGEQAQAMEKDDHRVVEAGRSQTFENIITVSDATRVYHTLKAPYRDSDGNVIGVIGIARDITELKQIEFAQRILAEAGEVLAASFDYSTRLVNLAQLAVPHLADWCAVAIVDEDGSVHNVAVAHVDPEKVALAHELQRRYPPDLAAPASVLNVIRTGRSEFYPDIPETMLEAVARSPEHLQLIKDLKVKSAMVVPLTARGRTLGAMTFVWAESGRVYDLADLGLAEELAHRAAMAVDNAWLYQAEQKARTDAEMAQQRLAFLVEIGNTLTASLDYETTLQTIARLALPYMADYCTVRLFETSKERPVAIAHVNPAKEKLLHELTQRYSPDPDQPTSFVGMAFRTKEARLIPEITEAMISDFPLDDELKSILRKLEPKSTIILPLIARGQTLGALTLTWAESDHRYSLADLALAQELAQRAALAIDNARLYREAQKLNAELEQRVRERTAELQAANARLESEVLERKHAEEELRKSKLMFEGLFESAPDAIVLVNDEGHIVRLNRQGEAMFGYDRQELFDKPIEFLIPARFRGRHIKHRAAYYSDPRIRPMGIGLELYGRHKDGSEFPVDVTISPLQTAEERLTIGVVRDVTQRKQAEEQIRHSKEFSERLINSSLDGIFAFDRDCRYTAWNPGMEWITGVSKADVIGQSAFEVFPFLEENGEDRYFYEALAGKSSIARDRPYRVPESGRSGFFEGYYSPVRDEGGEVVGGLAIIRNITERKQMEDELSEVRRRLVASREAERLHLAQELHDGPIQDLYGASYRLGELWEHLKDEASCGQLVAAQATLQRTVQMLRTLCGELRPPTLAPFGLEKAIRSHIEQFQEAHPELEIEWNLTPDGQTLSEQVRLALFRIYQEALNNIVRHAKANRIIIRFKLNTDQAVLEVQDDGCGFEMPERRVELARQGHLGLVGAAERTEAAGGELRVISRPGEGTLVQAVVPYVELETDIKEKG